MKMIYKIDYEAAKVILRTSINPKEIKRAQETIKEYKKENNIMKKLTKANCEKYGIEVAPEYDFTDDGNRFRGFIYNGIPMTQCFADNTCYLAIRVDYLKNNFTYKEWMQTEEYRLCDEFNGVSEINIEKLIENLKKIAAKVDEMNNTATFTEEDEEKLKAKIKDEICIAEDFIEDLKMDFQWWTAEPYMMKIISEQIHLIFKKIKQGKNIIDNLANESIWRKKEYSEWKTVLNVEYYINKVKDLCKEYMI